MFFLMFFFFNDTAPTEIYTLSLHDALPILHRDELPLLKPDWSVVATLESGLRDRKSTRLNSSHSQISYAVFCLKKKIKKITHMLIYLSLTTHDPRPLMLAVSSFQYTTDYS